MQVINSRGERGGERKIGKPVLTPFTEIITYIYLVLEHHGSRTREEKKKEGGGGEKDRSNAEYPVTFRPSPGRSCNNHPPGGLGCDSDSAV